MLMPGLSVSLIGIVIALVAVVAFGRPASRALPRGFLGAWLGFVVGALPGLVVDVLTSSGANLALFGHAGAVVGATVAVARVRLPEGTTQHPK